MLSKAVSENADKIRSQFQNAAPFRHACIEDFLEGEIAEAALRDFPAFNKQAAVNEFGEVGGKAVKTELKSISPFYAELFEYLNSAAFLESMSRLTGIPGLVSDPSMFGGGTHENLHGQELDPHVDFNFNERKSLHRRLNLLVYLNKEWETEWGGAIELHSNPRTPESNKVSAFLPRFNRAVLFETNEHSWHGFPRIDIPEVKRSDTSRKCLSIYLYTRERPAEEIAPPHGTFYVQRPLPDHIRAGRTLDAADVKTINDALTNRARWVELYQAMELRLSGQVESMTGYINTLLASARVPSSGQWKQVGTSTGIYGDGWMGRHASFSLKMVRPARSFRMEGQIPDFLGFEQKVTVTLGNAAPLSASAAPGGTWRLEGPVPDLAEGEICEVRVECAASMSPAQAGRGGDARELALLLSTVDAI